jgi:hypothetical protein
VPIPVGTPLLDVVATLRPAAVHRGVIVRLDRLAFAGTALLFTLCAAGCSSSPSESARPSTTTSAASSTPPVSSALPPAPGSRSAAPVQCSSLVGRPAADWVGIINGAGCWNGSNLPAVASFECKDGSKLVALGSDPFYWGMTTSALASQPGSPNTSVGAYGQAWKNCMS